MSKKTDILMTLGPLNSTSEWPDYLSHGFTTDDIPDLIALACNQALNNADGESDEVWAPIHAWRTLGQLGASDAVLPLLEMFDPICVDDWALEELPIVMGMIGEPAIEPLSIFLNERSHKEYARIMALDALGEIARRQPYLRTQVVESFRNYMNQPDTTLPTLNGLLMNNLASLMAVELIDDIRKLFELDCVDVSCTGDLEAMEITLGLRSERETPPPDYAALRHYPENAANALLDCFLARYSGENGIQNSAELHGFLTSLACSPEAIPPSHWLPALWGDDVDEPEWETSDDLQAFISAALTMHNEINAEFYDGIFKPLFQKQQDTGDEYLRVEIEWCLGFILALPLWPKLSSQQAKALNTTLESLWLFISETEEETLKSLTKKEIKQQLKRIGTSVVYLFDQLVANPSLFTEPFLRDTPKVGRNDPCPCGSGKKYKRCCLH